MLASEHYERSSEKIKLERKVAAAERAEKFLEIEELERRWSFYTGHSGFDFSTDWLVPFRMVVASPSDFCCNSVVEIDAMVDARWLQEVVRR